MDKSVYLKWYSLANEINPELIPKVTEEEIIGKKGLVSSEGWLMLILPPKCKSREDAKDSIQPNVYIHLYEEKNEMRMGIAFNTVKSVEKMVALLSQGNSEKRKELFDKLKEYENWSIILQKKNTQAYRKTPSFHHELTLTPIDLTEEKLELFFKRVKEVRKEGIRKQKLPETDEEYEYREAPSIDIQTIIPTNEQVFKEKVKQACNLIKICWEVLPENDAEEQVIRDAVIKVPEWEEYFGSYDNGDEALYKDAFGKDSKDSTNLKHFKKFKKIVNKMIKERS